MKKWLIKLRKMSAYVDINLLNFPKYHDVGLLLMLSRELYFIFIFSAASCLKYLWK